jgi:hypothetical protein
MAPRSFILPSLTFSIRVGSVEPTPKRVQAESLHYQTCAKEAASQPGRPLKTITCPTDICGGGALDLLAGGEMRPAILLVAIFRGVGTLRTFLTVADGLEFVRRDTELHQKVPG